MTGSGMTAETLRQRAGRVCIALAGDSMIETAHGLYEPFVEFRLDSLPDPAAAMTELRACMADRPGMNAIATCRREAFGGAFTGSAQEQIAVLIAAAHAGCALVDIEVETAEELGVAALETLRAAGALVILSWHDFAATPDLEAVYARMKHFSPDFYKIVPTATRLRDSLRVLDLLEKHGRGGNLIAISMGFKGLLTRVLGPRFGSVFTFASADGSDGTAPGQVSAQEMRELYRIDAITPKTAIYGVAGQPITGSKSPLMHNTAFAATKMDAVYLPFETANATELMEVVERLEVRGLSITMPLKEAVIPLLTQTDETVRAMGACNTILRYADGVLAGFNTDIGAIVTPLERHIGLENARVLVLGAGGAARAAAYGLGLRGATVWILNRTVGNAELLATDFAARVQRRDRLHESHFEIIVNCTPYGMRGQTMDTPIAEADMNCSIFFDTVYNPLETPLIVAARGRGIETIPGVAMFVEQGVRQFEIWTERTAPEGEMARAVVDSLEAAR
jgi:3-dehydroquinate dehydratase/shikimate dehydrogenase